MSQLTSRVSKIFRIAVAPVLIGSVFWSMFRNEGYDFRSLLQSVSEYPLWAIALGVIIYIGVLFFEGWLWRSELSALRQGEALSPSRAAKIFATSNLAKYIPGRIWLFVTQSSYLLSERVELKTSGLLAALLTVYGVASAVLVSCVGLIFLSKVLWIRLLAAVFFVVLFFFPEVARLFPFARSHPKLLAISSRYRPRLFAFFWVWVGHGSAAVVLALSLAPQSASVCLQVIVCNAMAWIGGAIAILTPAGLGAREAVFFIAASELPESLRVGLPVITRFCFIVSDLLAWAVVMLSSGLLSRRPK